MKKIYTLAVAAVFTTASFAQVSEAGNANLDGTKAVSFKHTNAKTPTDTAGWVPNATKWLPGEFALGGTVTLYGYTGGGSVFGTNISANLLDKCAQGYRNLNAATFGVEGVLIGFYRKDDVSSTDPNMVIELYDMAGNMAWEDPTQSTTFTQTYDGPNSLLASVNMPFSAADTNWFTLSYAQFASPATVSGTGFIAAVNHTAVKAANDTVGIASDQLGEGYRLAYHWVSANNRWYVTNDIFGNSLDNNIAIFPVIDDNFVGIEDVDFYEGMQLSAFPNPVVDQTTISYNLNENMSNVTLVVYDMTGKEVHNVNYGNQAKGSYNVAIDASEFTSGNYFYSLVANGNRLTKRMVVTK